MSDDLNKRCYDIYNTSHCLDDARFFTIHEALCPAPKVYAFRYDKHDGTGPVHEKVVAKGVPRAGIRLSIGEEPIGRKLTFDHLHRAIEKRPEEEYLTVERSSGFKRAGTRLNKKQVRDGLGLYDIYDLGLTRQLKLDYKARKPFDDEEPRFTVPLHYPDKRRRLM